MTNLTKILCAAIFFFFFGKGTAHAQKGLLGQEIGIVAGPVAYYTDYGLRYNMETNTSNTGIGIGLVYYVNFAYRADCNCYTRDTYFNDHFRIRAEVDYHWGELNHFGPIAQNEGPNGPLRNMIGSAKVLEMGAHLEYYPFSIRDYTAYAYPISPFASLGFNFVEYDPYTYSELGEPLEDYLFHTFQGGVSQESGSTWSVVLGIGTRYKIAPFSDLVVNLQWRYYDTDWLDGLNHDNPQNKFNDMMFWLNFGYIYYLNF